MSLGKRHTLLLSVTAVAGLAGANGLGGPMSAVRIPTHATVPVSDTLAGDTVQSLTFEWAAVNIALDPPYDTVQLRAIPRTAAGAEVHNVTVRYSTPDLAISVSGTGLVTAHQFTAQTPAHVIASVTQYGRTLTARATIQVSYTEFPGPLTTLSIHPQTGGLTSARGNVGNSDYNIGLSGIMPFFAAFTDSHVDPHAIVRICTGTQGCQKNYPLLVHFSSSDSTIAYINDENAALRLLKPGRVTLTVSTLAYGVHKRDSLSFSVGYNQRTTRDVYVDSSGGRLEFALRSMQGYPQAFNAPPYSVGLHVYIENSTREPVELTLPGSAHRARFVDDATGSTLPGASFTLPADNGTVVVLDSVGTHVLRYRGLNTGAVLNDTVTVLPYP